MTFQYRNLGSSLLQLSMKILFSEIHTNFRDGRCALSPTALAEMARLPEAAETLAWIGDAALKIGVLPQIWSPRLADAGLLSERRKAYESNVNMARLCDRWGLYEHRVHFDPPVEKGDCDHVKGTLVEAVLGIVFLQCGLKGGHGPPASLRRDSIWDIFLFSGRVNDILFCS